MMAPRVQTMPADDAPNIHWLERVSTDHQDLARQRTDRENVKARDGVNILKTVSLAGVSGTDTLNNAQVQEILDAMKDPGVDGVGVSSLDRLFRPGKKWAQWSILDEFQDNHKKIWSWREGLIDPSTGEGYDKCLQAGGRAGAEWRRLKELSHDGIMEVVKASVQSGAAIVPHGTAKFGYTVLPKRPGRKGREIVINEKEAVWVIRIFEWRYSGMKTNHIARKLNEAGVKGKGTNGKPPKEWTRTTVLQILRSTNYIGQHKYKGQIIRIPALVEEHIFWAVQEKMKASGRKWVGRPSTLYLFRNFLWCTRCLEQRWIGRTTGRYSDGRRRRVYVCGHKTNSVPQKRLCNILPVSADAIEAVGWGLIWSMLKDPKLLYQMGRNHFANKTKPHVALASKLERELAQLRQKDRNLERMQKEAPSDTAFEQYRKERKDVALRIAKLEVELRAAGRVINMPPLNVLEAALSRITSGKEPSTYERQRSILEGLLDLKMTYDEGELVITGSVPISDAQEASIPEEKNCYRTLCRDSNSFEPIPFILKGRVA